MPDDSKSRLPAILLSGAAALLVILGVVYLVVRLQPPSPASAAAPLPMGSAEQAYAPYLQFSNTSVGRAANFLNQEVTYVFGTVVNNGDAPVRQIEITLVFYDPFQQVVRRDTQRLLAPSAPLLAPGARRDFQIGYESLPATWNQAVPSIQISGLALH